MSYRGAQSGRSIDPHGYHPLVIDEDVLNADDRIKAFDVATSHPCNWLRYLTRAEVVSFETAIKEIEQNRSPYWFGPDELPAVQEKKFEMNWLGMMRAFARGKYGYGRRVWYGDGVPFGRRR